MSNGWTPARQEAQREAIRSWRPWEKSTGPKSMEGKKAVAQNALKHGQRSRAFLDEARELRELLAELSA